MRTGKGGAGQGTEENCKGNALKRRALQKQREESTVWLWRRSEKSCYGIALLGKAVKAMAQPRGHSDEMAEMGQETRREAKLRHSRAKKSKVMKQNKKTEEKEMKVMKVKLTFTEEVLGTASANPELHEEFIASKAPDARTREEEIEALGADTVFEKGMTVFPKDENGVPFLWDYQIKGFFKDSQKAMNFIGGKCKLAGYQKRIDDLLFIDERQIPFSMPDGSEIGICQRPLRAQTAQGERIALSSSETVPAGSTIEFTLRILLDSMMENVINCLDYGQLKGIGQWRNSGKGRFTWTEVQ